MLHCFFLFYANYLEYFRINIYDIKLRPYTNIVMLLYYTSVTYIFFYNRACLDRLF